MRKRKRKNVTLIEMMIVMFLIAMIIGVIAYNYQGSLDEGKAFKTKTGMEKVKTILMLKLSEDPDADIDGHWQQYVLESPLVQNGNALIKDGWGKVYTVHLRQIEGQPEIEILSDPYTRYKSNHKTMFGDDRPGS